MSPRHRSIWHPILVTLAPPRWSRCLAASCRPSRPPSLAVHALSPQSLRPAPGSGRMIDYGPFRWRRFGLRRLASRPFSRRRLAVRPDSYGLDVVRFDLVDRKAVEREAELAAPLRPR